MRSRMIAFLAGTITFWLLPDINTSSQWNIHHQLIISLLFLGGFAIFFISNWRKHFFDWHYYRKNKSYMVLFFIIGVLYPYLQYNHTRKQINLLPSYKQNIKLIGTIKVVDSSADDFLTLTLNLEMLNGEEISAIWRPRIKLNWYATKLKPQINQRWQFYARLKPIHGYANPFAFDYERWAWSNRIIASGYIVNKLPQLRLPLTLSFPQNIIQTWRDVISQSIKRQTTQSRGVTDNHVLEALILGNKNKVSTSVYQAMQYSGLAHLLAISGLHIGMVAFFSMLLMSLLWRQSNTLCRLLPAQYAGLVFGVFAAYLYMTLSGASIPAVRAFVMLLIFSLLKLSHLNWSLFQTLLTTTLLLVLFDPVIIISSSAWLSIGAVTIIAISVGGRVTDVNFWAKAKQWGQLNFAIWLGMVPLSILIFGGFAGLGFVANLLAIPVMTFWVMPALLLGSLVALFNSDVALSIWQFAEQGISAILYLSNGLVEGFVPVTLSKAMLVLLLLLILMFLLARAFATFKLSLAITAILIYEYLFFSLKPVTMTATAPSAKLVVFDVGQGLAVLWEFTDDNGEITRIMYDTAAGNDDFVMGRNTWLPYFKKQQITALDSLILSHRDNDHSGGVKLLLNYLSVGNIYASFALNNVSTDNCVSGKKVAVATRQNAYNGEISNININFLSPDRSLYRYKYLSTNNLSCVTELRWYNATILLPGDIEDFIEQRLYQQGKLKPIDVLIAPHHGSKTSSNTLFVKSLKPQVVIFSTGFNNRFQFPRQEVLNRYQQILSKQFNTAVDGAISCLWSNNGKFSGCESFRENYWGKWHWISKGS